MADFYPARRRRNGFWMGMCTAATALGLGWLVLILGALLFKGLSGLSLNIFTQATPLQGATDGGLLNPIVGSLIMTFEGVLLGAPLGMLAGTYMAEYGRHSKITDVVRFINDILLSAPSIIIGLFIYQLLVVPFGHFSALAGGVALAVLVIPVVVRTTEDMLNLVPNQMREAASAMGMPRSFVIRRVAYKAARVGITTGVLLAIARISGETAPLLFTALGNQFLSFDVTQPMSSLPRVIYDFAGSADVNQQKLAWTAALLITFTVLGLSIFARVLGASGGTKK
jgi:phosphate transport system permease protein